MSAKANASAVSADTNPEGRRTAVDQLSIRSRGSRDFAATPIAHYREKASSSPTSFQQLIASLPEGSHSFTRSQAAVFGLFAPQLRRLVQRGFIQPTGPQSFTTPLAESSNFASLARLLTDIGQPVFVCAMSAAALHGFDGFSLRPPFHLTVPRGRFLSRHKARIHTHLGPLAPIDTATVSGLPITSAVRTMIDLARTATSRQLTIALDSGLRDGKFSENSLLRRMDTLRTSGRHGIPLLFEVIEGIDVQRGGHSYLEREFLQFLFESGMPRPDTQQVLTRTGNRFVRVDFRFPGTNVVVEVYGSRYHRTPAQIQHDAARCNALLLAGMLPFQYGFSDVITRSPRILADLSSALRSAA